MNSEKSLLKMPTRVNTSKAFDRESKRPTRKFPSLEVDVDLLITQLEQDARPGIRLAGSGYTSFNVRLPNRSARRGKSGGFRVIYYERAATLVLLLIVYSKTERSDIPNEVIISLIDEIDQ